MAVRIVEVGPRDGLQNWKANVPTEVKLALIQRLEKTGLRTIELTSIVSPRKIPQLADGCDLLSSKVVQEFLTSSADLRLPVLVPNLKGFDVAQKSGVKEVAVFVSATEGFSKANINCSVQEGLERARSVAHRARSVGIAVRGYVSCIFTDPYDGPTPPSAVSAVAKELLRMGCYEVSLGDTLGVGSPPQVHSLISFLTKEGILLHQLAGHFHDTYGQALANVWEAYHCGIRTFDSSVGGLGGCPFAPGAKGNLATEDVLYMFHEAGIDTGVDLAGVVDTGIWISQKLKKPNESRAGVAIGAKRARTEKPERTSKLEWVHMSQTEELTCERAAVNLRIVLNRPRHGNALSRSMISDLVNIIETANQDASVSRIIITGTGRFFCSGMDLGKETSAVGQGDSQRLAMYDGLTRLLESIDSSPKVTIACINGPAFGGGIGLAFACDIRVSVRSASFTLSEVRLGLCPATISKYVVREWGVALAREAMLSARTVTAVELQTYGIIAQMVDDQARLRVLLDDFLIQLRHSAPTASRMAKELVRLAYVGRPEQDTRIKALFEEMMRPGSEGAHGVQQFQAKRRVDWDSYASDSRITKL